MQKFLFLVTAFVIGSCRAEGQMALAERFSNWSWDSNWSWEGIDPISFLERLKKEPEKALYLRNAPADWIRSIHIEGLIALLESTVPASVTCPLESAHPVPKAVRSTVGREAARMVARYRRGAPYPGSCSDLGAEDVQDILQWWHHERRK